jgi:hypothetical protein
VVLSFEDFSTEADRLEEELCGIFFEVLLSCTIRIQILHIIQSLSSINQLVGLQAAMFTLKDQI